jgi:class 3 adenylate cyclase
MTERTVAFVDLAGFTALTEAHGDADAVKLVERFVELARDAVAERGEMVKSIGDAVMLAFAERTDALDAVGVLFEACFVESGFPVPRAGMHHGPVVARSGDLFGGTVNLAARVAGHASGGQILATSVVAEVARDHGLRAVELGSFELRNLAEPVSLHEIDTGAVPHGAVIDPVCRMRVDRDKATGRLRHDDSEYWFCSLRCAGLFSAAPDRYVD